MSGSQKANPNPTTVDTETMLASLREAVSQALERKRRLGQYAVQWENGRVIFIDNGDPACPQNGTADEVR